MALKISQRILEKLKTKHRVTLDEVEQCFVNKTKCSLEDARSGHATVPPTRWFIADTDSGRRLKIVYVDEGTDQRIKSAFPANSEEERIYAKYSH